MIQNLFSSSFGNVWSLENTSQFINQKSNLVIGVIKTGMNLRLTLILYAVNLLIRKSNLISTGQTPVVVINFWDLPLLHLLSLPKVLKNFNLTQTEFILKNSRLKRQQTFWNMYLVDVTSTWTLLLILLYQTYLLKTVTLYIILTQRKTNISRLLKQLVKYCSTTTLTKQYPHMALEALSHL